MGSTMGQCQAVRNVDREAVSASLQDGQGRDLGRAMRSDRWHRDHAERQRMAGETVARPWELASDAQGPHPAFGDRVHAGHADTGHGSGDPSRAEDLVDQRGILGIVDASRTPGRVVRSQTQDETVDRGQRARSGPAQSAIMLDRDPSRPEDLSTCTDEISARTGPRHHRLPGSEAAITMPAQAACNPLRY